MSLLLKALKQAESAHPGKTGAGRADSQRPGGNDLELEPFATQTDAAQTNDWVEPPDLLFGNGGLAPAAARSKPAFRWPQLSLVPATAALAALVALGYGVYLYFALQPAAVEAPPPSLATPAALEPTPVAVLPAEPTAPAAALSEPRPAETRPIQAAPVASSAPPKPRVKAASSTTAARSANAAPFTSADAPLFLPDAQNTLLSQAYAAYQRGTLGEAQRLYTLANARGDNIDALLGLATLASVQNREADAQRLYRKVLDIDPKNATAQGALLDLLGSSDSQATETRLKTLIERDPSPQLHQTLGNLYASQGRWNDAQAAYFEAYRSAPDNADYAFNLAVSLDQLHQTPAALTYYEKALATEGSHRFDRAQAAVRVQQLKTAQ